MNTFDSLQRCGASLSENVNALWNNEHYEMLEKYADDSFEVLHLITMAELTVK